MASRKRRRKPKTGTPTGTTPLKRPTTAPSGRTGRRALVVLVVAVAILTIAAISRSRDGKDESETRNDDEIHFRIEPVDVLVLPGEPTDPVGTVAIGSYYDDNYETVHEVVRYDGESDRPMWRSMPIPLGDRAQLRNAGRQVIVSVDRMMYAFDLATGSEVWRTELSDAVPQECTACLLVVDGSVIVRPLDAVLQGIDATSGTVRWTHRLEDTAGTVRAVGPFLLVTDGPGPNWRTVEIDPETGTPRHEIGARCPAPGTTAPDLPTGLLSPDSVAVTAPSDPDVAYLGFGTWPACWQAWDLSAGALRWSTTLPDESLRGDVATAFPGSDLLYSTGHATLGVVDTRDGAVNPLEVEPEHVFTPMTSSDQIVAGVRISTRGTPQAEVVGLDRRTGGTVWSFDLGPATPIEGSVVAAQTRGTGTLREGDVVFDVGVVDGKLAVVTIDWAGDGTALVVDIADGTRSESQTWTAWGGTPPFGVRSEGWSGPTVILRLDEWLFAIDALEGRRDWSS